MLEGPVRIAENGLQGLAEKRDHPAALTQAVAFEIEVADRAQRCLFEFLTQLVRRDLDAGLGELAHRQNPAVHGRDLDAGPPRFRAERLDPPAHHLNGAQQPVQRPGLALGLFGRRAFAAQMADQPAVQTEQLGRTRRATIGVLERARDLGRNAPQVGGLAGVTQRDVHAKP